MTTTKQLQGCRQSINMGISALKLDHTLTNRLIQGLPRWNLTLMLAIPGNRLLQAKRKICLTLPMQLGFNLAGIKRIAQIIGSISTIGLAPFYLKSAGLALI